MSEKTSVLLSDVTIRGNVVEKEKLMTDAKVEGDVSADKLQTFEGSEIKGNINSSDVSLGGILKGNIGGDGELEDIRWIDIDDYMNFEMMKVQHMIIDTLKEKIISGRTSPKKLFFKWKKINIIKT